MISNISSFTEYIPTRKIKQFQDIVVSTKGRFKVIYLDTYKKSYYVEVEFDNENMLDCLKRYRRITDEITEKPQKLSFFKKLWMKIL
jgi:hypothetical protein